MNLPKRPVDVRNTETVSPDSREAILEHYDRALNTLDKRRIPQIQALPSGATLDEVVSAFNSLATILNNSDLTEE